MRRWLHPVKLAARRARSVGRPGAHGTGTAGRAAGALITLPGRASSGTVDRYDSGTWRRAITDVATLDLAPWASPELTGLRRVPMHSVPHAGARPPRRHLALPAAPRGRCGADRRLARHHGARQLGDAGHRRPAPVHEHRHALPGPAAPRPGRQPDRPLRPDVRDPAAVGRPADRPPCRGGRERGHRPGQRSRRRRRQGRPPGVGVRHQRLRGDRPEHGRDPGRQVVGRELRRGSGRVVARRDHPLGLPVRHPADPPGRREGDRGSGRRSRHRHPRPDRPGRVRRRVARARLDGRGGPRGCPGGGELPRRGDGRRDDHGPLGIDR